MRPATHRKQILLFVIAVILPSAALVFFTSRMIDQERELAEKRERDQERLVSREFGQSLLTELERIKLQELEAFRTSEQRVRYVNPEVELVGLVDESGLQLPWEFDPRRQRSFELLNSSSFALELRQGEEEEFSQNSPKQAAKMYRRALASFEAPVQQGFARLSLARVLAKVGSHDESLAYYLDVLRLPFEVVDEAGIPLALYAAGSLIERGNEDRELVAAQIQSELSSVEWFSPSAAYLLKELSEQLTEDCAQFAVEHLAKVEQSLALQRDFPGLRLLQGRGEDSPRDRPLWAPYGDKLWLVSLVESGEESQCLLVAVGASEVLESVVPEQAIGDTYLNETSLVAAASTEGETLGPSFPGLKVDISTEAGERSSESSGLHGFYRITLLLVLGVTFFGAYLLWRDVRREVKAAELRSQFVSSVSHELKTPLTAIQMFSETLRLGRTRNKQTQEEYLETIVNESQRLTRLLNNVLDFSRIEAGKKTYRPQPTNLNEVVQDAVKAMEYPLRQEGFELNVETKNDLPEVLVDRDGLEQALLNLLSNAMKYSGSSRQINLTLRREDSQAVIQVADRGVGIEPKEQKRIFEKFYRVASAESQQIPGTGLGLSLVSHLVREHKGRLDLESRPGEGSTFTIYLPLEEGS